ncbi:MAG: branched-chain amino acid ABC transporter permease [Rhodospirillales bacterium]|nr:branched-chain amino acid ABC transporter permease [Rhodospirillales bacterium]MCW8951562.1 branched-chain amino acid ABC transporter permease [Rhodospirillales bacterium]MCW8971507.1 branched-chain amino acid ABC transporter permease [Rhodospirillales bacterium]
MANVPGHEDLAAEVPISGRRVASLMKSVAKHRVAAVLLFLLFFPWIMPYEALAVNILIFGLFAMGFNLLFGYTGLLSFGHAAFFGVGAYGTGIAIAEFGVPWLPAILIGLVFVGLTAAAVGALAVRTRGIYFAMVTLALSQCVYYIVYQMPLSGGENGLRGIDIHEVDFVFVTVNMLDPMPKYYFMLAFVAAAIWLFSRILASPFGGVLEAIRENENRARACGYDVRRTKWVAFVISGLFCGLAGALYGIHLTIVPIETLHYHTSGEAVMMSLLGGMGTFFGPFVGATTFLLLQDIVTNWTENWQLFVGALFVCLVLFFPRGIWGSILHWLSR